jgi:hypothetical protein
VVAEAEELAGDQRAVAAVGAGDADDMSAGLADCAVMRGGGTEGDSEGANPGQVTVVRARFSLPGTVLNGAGMLVKPQSTYTTAASSGMKTTT